MATEKQVAARRSLPKDLYDATARPKQLDADVQNGVNGDQTVTRDAVQKLTNAAENLASWLYRDAR